MFTFDFTPQIQSFLNNYSILINGILIVCIVAIFYISYKNITSGIQILILFFPLYLFRTSIGKIPSTFLEIALWAVLIPWIIQLLKKGGNCKLKIPEKLPILLFLLAATFSIFVSNNQLTAMGIWKAYFIEPILLFILIVNTARSEKDKEKLVVALGLSTLSIVLIAISQKFTGWGIAQIMWAEESQRRVTAFFTSPNAIGLYAGPILVIYFGWLISIYKNPGEWIKKSFIVIIIALNLMAILFTQSQGTWLAIISGAIFILFFSYNKKIVSACILLGLLFIIINTYTRELLLPYITFSDRSGQNRLSLWQGSLEFLTSSPKNFIFGSGLSGFSAVHETFRNPKITEPLIYPHNSILNFWMEIGIFGLLAVIWLLIKFFRNGMSMIKNKISPLGDNNKFYFLTCAAMVTILVHGLIDVPYFKNDLSMIFWTLFAIIYI